MAQPFPVFCNSISSLASFLAEGESVVLAIGVFDGVHLGHRKLLRELLHLAEETRSLPVVMTFSPHPRTLLMKNPPRMLYSDEDRGRLLCEAGAKGVVTVPFTKEFSLLEPETFLEETIFNSPVQVKGICVGQHWRFGAGARGDRTLLEKVCSERGIQFSPVEELRLEDPPCTVSSTLIREAVSCGDLEKVRHLLGRAYSLNGVVVKGYQVAGNELGTPTANLQTSCGVLPPFGVYGAFARIGEESDLIPAAVNIGVSPTFREKYGQIEPRIEVHLLDHFRKDIYGRQLCLFLEGFIRRERTFGSAAELKQQIQQDIESIHALLERNK